MKHLVGVLTLALVIVWSCTAYGGYLKKNVYQETDCSGAAPWTTFTLNVCTGPSGDNTYQVYDCDTTVYSLTCYDAACTNCTRVALLPCYLQEGSGSSNYECVDAIPDALPDGSFIEEQYDGTNCTGTVLFFQSYSKNYCIAGNEVSTSYVCSDDGELSVKTCLDSGTCDTECTSGPQNLGCSSQNVTTGEKSVRISCTGGNAPYTTGSATSSLAVVASSSSLAATTSTSSLAVTSSTSSLATTSTSSLAATSSSLAATSTSTLAATSSSSSSAVAVVSSTTSAAATSSATSTTYDSSTTTITSNITTSTTAENTGETTATTTTTISSTSGSPVVERYLQVDITNVTQNSVTIRWRWIDVKKRLLFFFLVELFEAEKLGNVIYNGTDTTVTITALRAQTSYIVRVSYYSDTGDNGVGVLSTFSSANFSTQASPDNVLPPDANPNSNSNTGTIVGLVVGLFVGLLLLILLLFIILRIRKKQRNANHQEPNFEYENTGGRRRATIGIAALGTGISMREIRMDMFKSNNNNNNSDSESTRPLHDHSRSSSVSSSSSNRSSTISESSPTLGEDNNTIT